MQIPMMARNPRSDSSGWASSSSTPSRKRRVVHAKPRLNGRKRRDSWWPGFIRMAHSAGVSVSAMKPEITTAKVSVTANCR